MQSIGVTALNEQIKSLLESTFVNVCVEGEVSRPTYHSSGHLYFTLKDENSSISCVMFKGNNLKLKFCIEEGMKLTLWGAVSLYVPRGVYQIICSSAQPSGEGALSVAYEQLKKELSALGYFESSIKKPIPKFPTSMAFVTSATGAALQDMLQVATKRCPLVKIRLYDTLVQGEGAKEQIVEAIKSADTDNHDLIVVARGGGSIEDLWAFNEKDVATALYEAKTPIVSAIGHEIDYVISDFVADLRAPTPSAAMELVLPDCNQMKMMLDSYMQSFEQRFLTICKIKQDQLNALLQSLKLHSLDTKFELIFKEIATCRELFELKLSQIVQKKEYEVASALSHMQSLSLRVLQKKESSLNEISNILRAKEPKNEVRFGFAQVVKNGKVNSPESLKSGEEFEIQTPKVIVKSVVKSLISLEAK